MALLSLSGLAGIGLDAAHAQPSSPEQPTSTPPATTGASRLSFSLPTQAGPHNGKLPLFFEADTLEGEANQRTRATGSVRLRQGDLTVRADELTHTQPDNTARAFGNVRITRNGNIFSGPELTLKLDTLEGEFIRPQYWFLRTQAGGQADLIEFLGNNRMRAHQADYSSCTPANTADGKPGEPDWWLRTSRVDMDFDANEGRAENAVIWFKGLPILAAPVLTFPLTEARKSGWLPPSIDYDTRNGLGIAEPYYWNIAPNMDATLTPTLSSRRGMGLGGEFRFLTEHDRGTVNAFVLPDDRVKERDRGMIHFRQAGTHASSDGLSFTTYNLRWRRVSDDDYWKDFSRTLPTLTPRLYDSNASVERQLNARDWGLGDSQTALFASTQSWQVLRDTSLKSDPVLSAIEAPYRRNRAGLRSRSVAESGLTWRVQGRVDQFTHQDGSLQSGLRSNLTGTVEQTFAVGGVQVTPRLSLDDTRYDVEQALANGSRSAARTLPTFSVDAGFTLERPVTLFDRALTQTLEPRIQYVRTPYKDQSMLPMFDTAARDFNQYAIYSENAYTGVDRISDANQVTLGLTSRLFDQRTGAEALRLGVVQKVLLADQRINPTGDGPITQRLSDLLLLGSTSVIPNWYFDNVLQLNAQTNEPERATMGMRYSPGGYRTISAIYRYARERTNQFDLGWQWPIAGRKPSVTQLRAQASSPDQISLNTQPATSSASCGEGGTWYSVGRFNYNIRDGRMANSLLGMEYDAGCWITRVVAERTTVGTTSSRRIMIQLELVGLSRIGSNPLSTLRDNIPGYRLLREDDSVLSAPASQQIPSDD